MISSSLASSLTSETAPARDRIPVEYIGLARDLRRRIDISARQAAAELERICAPLRGTDRKSVIPSHQYLKLFGKKFTRLPAFGRLNQPVVKFANGRLQIAELRLIATTIALEDWDGENELAVAVGLLVVTAEPPRLAEQRILLAVIGLHALARRYQRSPHRSDTAVLGDMIPLAQNSFGIAVAHPGEFAVEVPSGTGRWIGAFQPRAHPGILVRTFR